MFDPRIEQLAVTFLPDRWFPERDRFAADLAQTIQDVIEEWFDIHVRDVEACAAAAALAQHGRHP